MVREHDTYSFIEKPHGSDRARSMMQLVGWGQEALGATFPRTTSEGLAQSLRGKTLLSAGQDLDLGNVVVRPARQWRSGLGGPRRCIKPPLWLIAKGMVL